MKGRKFTFWIAAVMLTIVLFAGRHALAEECFTTRLEDHALYTSRTTSNSTDAYGLGKVDDETYREAQERIVEAALACETYVDVSDLKLECVPNGVENVMSQLSQVYFGTQEDHPEIFWLSDNYSYYPKEDNGTWYAVGISLVYIGTDEDLIKTYTPLKESYDLMRNAYESRVEAILDSIPAQYTTDLEKALYLHDYLALHNVYDPSEGGYTQISHSAYGAIVKGVTVCSGYSRAYKDLLTRLGISCRFVRSDELNHSWNMVEIDGVWYEVDLTWDDSYEAAGCTCADNDNEGKVSHQHFLVSTDTMLLRHESGNGKNGKDAYCYTVDEIPVCAADHPNYGLLRWADSAILKSAEGLWHYCTVDGYYYSLPSVTSSEGKKELLDLSSFGDDPSWYLTEEVLYFSAGRNVYAVDTACEYPEWLVYTFPSGSTVVELILDEDELLACTESEKKTIASGDAWVKKNGKYYLTRMGYCLRGKQYVEGDAWYYLDPVTAVMATGWIEDEGAKYYAKSSGRLTIGWKQIGGLWYYFEKDGTAATRWVKSSGKWYYCEQGLMVTDTVKVIDGKTYGFSADGIMLTGWQTIGGEKYCFKSDGSGRSGWYKDGGLWYYLKGGSILRDTTVSVGGKVYRLDEDGVMVTGWITVDGQKYYYKASGEGLTGWVYADKKWHYCVKGCMKTDSFITTGGATYYVDAQGNMRYNWAQVNGLWYFFDKKAGGAMVTGWLDNGGYRYYMTPAEEADEDHPVGSMVTGTRTIGGVEYTFTQKGRLREAA